MRGRAPNGGHAAKLSSQRSSCQNIPCLPPERRSSQNLKRMHVNCFEKQKLNTNIMLNLSHCPAVYCCVRVVVLPCCRRVRVLLSDMVEHAELAADLCAVLVRASHAHEARCGG